MTNPKHSFSIKQRVFYGDTDALGIVYHANYLRFMERVRSEWLWSLDLCFEALTKQQIAFAVHHVTLDYRYPARTKDHLLCTIEVSHIGKTSVTFDQSIRNADNTDIVYCDGKVRTVCITPDGKPCPLPELFLEALS